jgi:muramoyltetrapeptide carboxypeptidase
MAPIIKPKELRRGDAIGVVAPAGPVNRERIDRAIARLQGRGFRTKTYGDIYRSRGYLAGDDATRAKELMEAFADTETAAVWCARGGYGVVRLLEQIDFEVIRCNPKVFVGFSDITVLHIAIQQRTGLITFHGPNLQDGFGKTEEMPAANEAALWQAVGVEAFNAPSPVPLPKGAGCQLRSISGGVVRGRLTGGNLAVLCGLMGTPFEIETAGGILFIEDISERIYRIDRYLAQLALAGKLRSAAGVLVGSFSYEADEKQESATDVSTLLDEYLKPLGIPALAGFPAGHTDDNLALPMGGRIEIDADSCQVRIVEDCVVAR